DVDADADGLPPPLARSVFHIAQEALRNAVRHAKADEVSVCVERSNGTVELEVHDDGRGFEVPYRLHSFADAGHFGLVGMAERVEQAGGSLTVESAPGAGTTVIARLPATAPKEGDD
ncbi:MAG TPA: ATP-binding protein, partial [Thermomicrobiales bacterium]|nr:ATP-binding protein [Thermomicrobiales bacterium]